MPSSLSMCPKCVHVVSAGRPRARGGRVSTLLRGVTKKRRAPPHNVSTSDGLDYRRLVRTMCVGALRRGPGYTWDVPLARPRGWFSVAPPKTTMNRPAVGGLFTVGRENRPPRPARCWQGVAPRSRSGVLDAAGKKARRGSRGLRPLGVLVARVPRPSAGARAGKRTGPRAAALTCSRARARRAASRGPGRRENRARHRSHRQERPGRRVLSSCSAPGGAAADHGVRERAPARVAPPAFATE